MKSQVALFAMVLAIITIAAGCGAKLNQVADSQKSIKVQSQIPGYEIIRKVYEDKENNKKILYPQISGYKGQLLMDYMNQSLKRIVESYGKKETYTDINIDYRITKMDKNIISVLFKGTGKISGGKEINIQSSVNLDIKTSNAIEFENLIKSDQSSRVAVRAMIKQKAKQLNHMDEFEGVRLYFEGENIVFYYMPADDSTTRFVEISVPVKELESYLNTDFGEKPGVCK